VTKSPPISLRSLTTILAMALSACAASSKSSSPAASGEQGVVLLRTYYVALRPDVELGKAHPPLNRFIFAGYLPGGQDARSQLNLLSRRLTLPSLGFQFSDAAAIGPGKDATLHMGFGEMIEIRVADLARAGGGAMTAGFSFRFGEREALRRTLPFKTGEPLLFCGHLDASLPILSAFTLEIRMFPPEKRREMEDFLAQGERERQDFASPSPTQRDREPYLPGVGDVTMPDLVSRENAAYPDAARPERLDGQVIVEVTVDREGKAISPRILTSSSPIFEPAALESAKTYRYKPATKQGRPVAVTMNLVMIFKYTAKPGP
jgi:TonB family protein